MPRSLLSCSRASIHHREPAKTLRGRKSGILRLHGARGNQDGIPPLFSRGHQWDITEQVGRIREQQSIHFSKHVSILGLQSVVAGYGRCNRIETAQGNQTTQSTNKKRSAVINEHNEKFRAKKKMQKRFEHSIHDQKLS